MPNPYAHLRFGLDVLSGLDVNIQNIINDNFSLFEYGLQGPDILFFHNRIFSNKYSKLGSKIHHEPFYNIQNENTIYMYGMICHFVLDSICHTYINNITRNIKISHSNIEKAFDVFLLKMDNKSKKYKPMQSLIYSENIAYIFADFYKVNVRAIKRSIRNMKRYKISYYNNKRCNISNNYLFDLYTKSVNIAVELINTFPKENEIFKSTFSNWSGIFS